MVMGLARYYQPGYYITLEAKEGLNGKPAHGMIWNITPERSFYQADVRCADINDKTAYLAAKIERTNNSGFGPWILIKIVDGTPDQIWGQFVDETTALAWCLSPTDPLGGPWNVLMGDLVVKN